MVKRVRDQDEGQSEDQRKDKKVEDKPVITLTEEWNVNLLKTLHELKNDDEVTDALYKSMYYDLKSTNDNKLRVEYRPSKNGFNDGRVYGKGLQGCSKFVRRLNLYNIAHDIDGKNMGPTIVYQKLGKLNIEPGMIKEFAMNRDSIFNNIRGREIQVAFRCSRSRRPS